MSLEALNYPPLVTAVGAGALVALPILEGVNLSLLTLKCATVIAYWINFAAVSVPGRIDGAQAEAREAMEQLSPGRQGRTLLSPAGWAFAIWGPIFAGELIFSTAQLLESPAGPMVTYLSGATIPYVMANVFQSLWCASFRPKYIKTGWMGVSFAALASTAFSLSKVHKLVLGLSGWRYLVYGLPISLHFGWVTAAALVNLNGAIAMNVNVSAETVAWAGHVSVVAATALGILVTVTRRAPLYGCVIGWALAAVADGMEKRIDSTKQEKDQRKVGLLGAKTQRRLSQVGSFLTVGTSVVVAFLAATGSRKPSSTKVEP